VKEHLKKVVCKAYTAYVWCYDLLCGRHPRLYPWHFQWHAIRFLNRDMDDVLPTLRGRVLDLGCGLQPYRGLLDKSVQYVGVDIAAAPGVDVVIEEGAGLPFPDTSFDGVLSTQVFEHVADLEQCVAEIRRVLKPGGTLVLSVPFIYQLHGKPHDYRRLTEYGVVQMLRGFSVDTVRREGAVGSTLAVLFLGWVNAQLSVNTYVWAIKALLLPVWIVASLLVNMLGLLLDFVDSTGSFYGNLFALARKE